MSDTRKTHRRRILAAVLAVGFVLVGSALFSALLMHYGLMETPDFLKDLFGDRTGQETVLPGDEGRLYEALKNGSHDRDVSVTWDLSAEEKYELLRETKEAETYTFCCTVSRSDGSRTVTEQQKIWRDRDCYRIETYEKGTPVRTVVCDGSTVAVTTRRNGETVTTRYGETESFTLADQAGTVSLEDFINADTIGADNFAAAIVRTADTAIWYAEYLRDDLPQNEVYYLSLEYGLTVRCEIYYEGTQTYKLTTDSLLPYLDESEHDRSELFDTGTM